MRVLRYYEPGKIQREDNPPPQIGPGEALVKVYYCGVCATDLKTYLRGHPKIKPGAVLGHEVSGVIIETKQTPGWSVGQRVAVAPYAPCGKCESCRLGFFTQCEHLFEVGIDPGGFSEFIRVPARLVQTGMVALPENLSLVEAALSEPVACCLHGLEVLNLRPVDSLLIVGDGTMGLLQAEIARSMKVEKIVLAGMIPHRLERASRVVDWVINVGENNLVDKLQDILPGGASKVIVSVGSVEVAQQAFKCVRKGGTINLYAGLSKGDTLTVDATQLHYDEICLTGTFGFAPNHFQQAVEFLSSGRICTEGIITDVAPFDRVEASLQAVAEYRGIKSILKLSDEGGAVEE